LLSLDRHCVFEPAGCERLEEISHGVDCCRALKYD
jgi:hypothetical protein